MEYLAGGFSMKFFVLGSTGMLGAYMSKYFSAKYQVENINREQLDASSAYATHDYGALQFLPLKKNDIVINCIGMIKPQVDKYGIESAIRVNSMFPRTLSNACKLREATLIHITTDCVFSGKDGPYHEESPHDANDVYGKTKSLGEPENCMVIRTSIVGEEKTNKRSLVEWVKSNAGKKVNGYINHLWNGVTCLQLAKSIEDIMIRDVSWLGVRHVFTPQSMTKYYLVDQINQAYNLNMSVIPVTADVACDRTMTSVYEPRIKIPSIEQQIKEMKEFTL